MRARNTSYTTCVPNDIFLHLSTFFFSRHIRGYLGRRQDRALSQLSKENQRNEDDSVSSHRLGLT